MAVQGSILLADDEETFLAATGDLLEEEGYDCHRVHNADELAHVLGVKDFDLLITDLNMPGNQVLEMVDEIRRQSKALPVIVVTGYPSIPSAVESVRLNVLEYIIKPVQFPSLLDAVKRGVRQKHVLGTIRKAKQEAEERAKRLADLEKTVSLFQGMASDEAIEEALVTDLQVKELQRQVEHLAEIVEPQESTLHSSSVDFFQLREGLHETIQVLHRTKSAFKSKDLASLRIRLEKLLQETSLPSTP